MGIVNGIMKIVEPDFWDAQFGICTSALFPIRTLISDFKA